ncbi:hypothetical protein ACI77O_12255 [Pseudomonas tritici]|uniref:hypothetical protein n=1 Tax=Pseudomonas tritici TaxID=2745518 RepID=UPI00387B05A3
MNWNDLERHFSPARLGRYCAHRQGDQRRAAADYMHNVQMAGAMVPMLNVLEIALRNAIHRRLESQYQRPDWWVSWANVQGFSYQCRQINDASAKLARRGEQLTPDKIIAELTFGFWSSLFNVQFQGTLWKSLRLVFAHCPKAQRQRGNISGSLNQIRDLRNRVFHHEPLLWLTPDLLAHHTVGLEVVGWLDPQLAVWLGTHDQLPTNWQAWLTT